MIYVWDTDTCIYWLKGQQEIRRKVQEIGKGLKGNLSITIVTLAELKYGAYRSHKVLHNLKNIDNFLQEVKVLNLNQNSADQFGKIKADLRERGNLIEDFDILIASITKVNYGILVTNNTDHFRRIEGLNLENWLYEKRD